MADHAHVQPDEHPSMDYAEHERTYRQFTTFVKWGSVVVAAIMVSMAMFLV